MPQPTASSVTTKPSAEEPRSCPVVPELGHSDHDNVRCYSARPYPRMLHDSAFTIQTLSHGVDQTSPTRPDAETLRPVRFRESWQTLLRHDTTFIFANLRSLFRTAWLSISTKPRHGTELYNPSKLGSFGGHVMLGLTLVLTIPLAATVLLVVPSYLLLRLFTGVAESLQGKATRQALPLDAEFVPGHEREAWLLCVI